jgi:hypothetical protein
MRRGSMLACLLAMSMLCCQAVAWAQSCPTCSAAGCSKVTMEVYVPGQPTQSVTLPWVTNLNVLTAMTNATVVSPSFSFTSTSYCPWGAFISTINGYTPASPYYWELSVHGRMAAFGPSLQPLKPNDIFAWRVVNYSESAAKKGAARSQQHLLYLAHIQAGEKSKP